MCLRCLFAIGLVVAAKSLRHPLLTPELLAILKDVQPKPVLLLPSFAGSVLRTWSAIDCDGPLDFAVGDRVYVDARMVGPAHGLGHSTLYISCLQVITETGPGRCFLDCMRLHVGNQTVRFRS